MSKKILFLKTTFQYLLIYFSSFTNSSLSYINSINRLHPILFGLFFILALTILTFSTFFYIVLLFVFGFLRIFYGFLEAYQVFLTIRFALDYFPTINPYRYPALRVFIKLTEPYYKLMHKIIPPIQGYNLSLFFAFIIFGKFIEIFSFVVGTGDGGALGRLLGNIPTFFDLKEITEAVITTLA